MTQARRFPFWPVMLAVVLSAASAHAETQAPEKFAPAAMAAAARKAVASVPTAAKAAPQCTAPNEVARLDRPLTRIARLIASGQPVRIVAIGSSSTVGAGASAPEMSYPSRLAVELRERFPGHEFTVLNRGVNGEEARDMLARFETTVMNEKPDLVLWQVGTNAVLRDSPVAPASTLIEKGLTQLKAAGVDIILIDPQFAPKVIAKNSLARMLDTLAFRAKQFNVNLFQRFALMRDWRERQGIPFETFVSNDHLHMNDWSYACVAKVLGTAIAEAATRATASASASAATRAR